MNTKSHIIVILALLIGIVSCRKKEAPVKDDIPSLIIGVDDNSVTKMVFPAPITIPVVYDSLNLYGVGSYALDFDLDGENDVTFELNLLNYDSIHLLNGGAIHPYPNLALKSNGKISIIKETEIVYVGLGATTSLDWLKANSNGDEIANISNWSKLNEQGIKMWHDVPLALSHKGTWHNLDENKFIAFRFADKLGWIEVNATNRKRPFILSYAIQR